MMKEHAFEGIAVSPGFVVGKILLFDLDDTAVLPHGILKKDVGPEIARFEDALIETRKELLEIRQNLADSAGKEVSDFFEAHLLVVEDRSLITQVVKGIEEKKLNAEYIFQEVINEYTRAFLQIKDDYIKERLSDIKDVARRVLHNLTGKKRADLA
ncbi:MAG: phosphoenolpyruvate-utilizing N-terminal domain-containing protein, partial [Candidatus Auribacterota bacterium]|nr:phosphoenolpyruvate-utilizing N-terminal domain-containing protein [Candidatus Auribacterota bacterium]